MKSRHPLAIAALLGMTLTLPFAFLEKMHRHPASADLPVMLYVSMWLVAAAIAFLVIGLVRKPSPGRTFPKSALTVGLLALLVVAWVGIIADQWPCFLGMANCD